MTTFQKLQLRYVSEHGEFKLHDDTRGGLYGRTELHAVANYLQDHGFIEQAPDGRIRPTDKGEEVIQYDNTNRLHKRIAARE